MKISLPICLLLTVAVSTAWPTRVQADNKVPAGSPAMIQSVFNVPSNPKEGRDPFFPESTHAIESVAAASRTVEITTLKVFGISGTPGHLLAIINNHTFGVGEEGDVKTTAGTVHIRCLGIQASSVVIEINGQAHRLSVESQ